jgi:hypothetical protein
MKAPQFLDSMVTMDANNSSALSMGTFAVAANANHENPADCQRIA